ncbi:uncharacterized protein LOC142640146 [Castanea sativa]|uniref:uncharacterized protein LOC142640146 n=1 Tax=Castanea sativa TaxID=21020 RepID=UPI003F64A65C
MVGSGPNREESVGSQCQDQFLNLEQRRDRKVSIHTTHTSRSHSRSGSHVSHRESTRNMQLEIDHLRRKLHRKQWKGTPSSSESPFDGDDDNYRPRSKTPPSESFSCDEGHHYTRKSRSPSRRGLGNDAMCKALHQISNSPFIRRIEGGKLPWRFTQSTFTMYNGRTNPVEHVSHFNQRMVVHSKNEALMCKMFPSTLGPVTMRWFNGLEEGLINSFQELTRTFGAIFVTCSKVTRPLNSLLSMVMREGETLKTYSDSNKVFGLLVEHDLRNSLTRKPAKSVHQLMDRVDEYKQVEKDQQQGKGKAKETKAILISAQWIGEPDRVNTSEGYFFKTILGTISVILTAPGRIGSYPSRVMSIARPHDDDLTPGSKRCRMEVRPTLNFSDKDKVGTLQPHDDAPVVTFRIGGYDVKRVLVDQGSGAEIMYPNLYKRLKLKPEDLVCYDSPLMGFGGKTVIPRDHIRLPIQTGLVLVEVDFIVVDAYSPYTAIMVRP